VTVSLYTGHVGSGKSYEVVKSVILPALARGRAVVSNIEGLDGEAISEWLERDGVENPGELVIVGRLDLRKPDFFPARQADGSYLASEFVPLGAVVVVDEAPFYWGTDKSILPAHLAFFREHRHIVAEDGTACDLVVVSQTVDAVHRSLKGLVEFSVDCRRLAALGLNRKYTTVTYEGAKRSAKYVMGRATKTYDKRIFPLYRSFAAAHGKILQTDKRFTIWSSKWFWAVCGVSPIVFIGALVMLYHQFLGSSSHAASPGGVHNLPLSAAVLPGAPVRSVLATALIPPPPAPPPVHSDIGGESIGPVSVWRVVGSVTFRGKSFAVLRRVGFPLRYMPLSMCLQSFGRPIVCHVGSEAFEPETASPVSPWAADTAAAASVKGSK
jgi:zona occludens toxin